MRHKLILMTLTALKTKCIRVTAIITHKKCGQVTGELHISDK